MRARVGPIHLLLAVVLTATGASTPVSADTTNRSSSIALNKAGSLLFNVNFEANSVTVFEVGKGGAGITKADEVAVGREPTCVAIAGQKAYGTNSENRTVSLATRTRT